MTRRKPPAHAGEFRLVLLAMTRLEEMLNDRNAAIRLGAAREILRRAGGRTTAAPATPGQSSTDAALQAEDELSRRREP